MLEARVEIPDELAGKGFKRAMTPTAVPQIAAYYGNRLAALWVVIAIADGLAGAGHLIPYHLAVMVVVWIGATLLRYNEWSKEILAMKGWSFLATLDEEGVTTKHDVPLEHRIAWSHYKNYVEYETYMQIEDVDGHFSFLPKTPELFQLIEFTKGKIPAK